MGEVMAVTPRDLLDAALEEAKLLKSSPGISQKEIVTRIDYVCRCTSNRAGVRLLMSCMLAKMDHPEVDPRKPYTEIGGTDTFSGRTYDEQFLTNFISTNRLRCNSTTAFLTPALRNHNIPLSIDNIPVGRPQQVYEDTLLLLDDVANGLVSAKQVLVETLRCLLVFGDENQKRMKALIDSQQHNTGALPLASEQIVTLLQQHLACKHSSRLPVLIVAAAYQAAAESIGEQTNPLLGHLAADKQTGAGGDIEVFLTTDEQVVTIYEMKAKRVSCNDIDLAVEKIASRKPQVDNYVFITTDAIDARVAEYAATFYEQTHGTEIAILDCMGFARHFLHLFHRLRIQFLDFYQDMVLSEPDSAVNQPLKEAFLSLRQTAESDE